MTGLLAVTGVLVVILASAYSGLTHDDDIELLSPGIQITPVTDVDSGPRDRSTPEPTATPEEAQQPEPTPTPVLNRLDCDQIRGTDYFSPEERTWFLANCVNN